MKYVSQEITDFIETNLTETVPVWSSTTTYSVGNDVLIGSYIYRSLIDNNLGFDPIEYSDIKWMKYQVSNKYAMLDLQANSKSIFTPISVTISTIVDDGANITVTTASNASVVVGGSVVITNTTNFNGTFKVTSITSQTSFTLESTGVVLAQEVAGDLESIDLVVIFAQNKMDTLTIGNYSAKTIEVQVLDTDMTTVLWSYESQDTTNVDVEDWWTYLYSDYGEESDRALKVDLGYIGTYVKVIFNKATTLDTDCGYLVGGSSVDMGATLDQVKFSFNSFATKQFDSFGTLTLVKRSVQDLVDFETIVDSNELSSKKRKIKSIYNDIIVFIVDETDASMYENLLTLGTVQDASVVFTNNTKSIIAWSVIEVI